MGAFNDSLARFLLRGKVPSKAVAAKLIAAAKFKEPMDLQVVPDDTTALQLTKNSGWATAASLAQSSDSPAFLKEMARNSSLQVRRLVAANPHTSDEVVRALHHWALHTKFDEELLALTIPRLDVEFLLEELDAARNAGKAPRRFYPLNALGEKIVALQDGNVIEQILRSAPHDVVLAAANCYSSSQCVLTPRRFFQATPQVIHDQVGRLVAHRITHVGIDEARLLLEIGIFETYSRRQSAGWRTYPGERYLHSMQSIDPEAARLWIEADCNDAHDAVAMCLPDPGFIDPLLSKGNPQLGFTLLQMHLSSMRIEQIEVAVAQLGDPQNPEPPSELLDQVEEPLSTQARLVILARCGPAVATRWLCGATNQDPRPGEIDLLVEKPGRAFQSRWAKLAGVTPTNPEETASPDEVNGLVLPIIEAVVTKPWADETVDACGGAFVQHMVGLGAASVSQYVSDRITSTVGDSDDAYTQAVMMLSRSKTSLGRTLQTVVRMQTPEAVAGQEEVVYPDGRLFEI